MKLLFSHNGKVTSKNRWYLYSEEKQKLVRSALKHYDGIDNQPSEATKKTVGGVCMICHGIPIKKLIYQMDGATKTERYSDRCFSKI